MSYSVPVNLVVVFSFIVFLFYILGIHNILTNLGENGCEMTYMFEFPQFVDFFLFKTFAACLTIKSLKTKYDNILKKYYIFLYYESKLNKILNAGVPVEISLPRSVHQAYPKYALFGYAEGKHTEKLRKMKFDGIPVLFIPGSSGSYKQGRSLASVSLRMALNSRTPFYFDYFMIDFNEDQSGLYGGILEDQTKFVNHCINKISSFYIREPTNTSKSIILIGHSLGGLIAKALFLDNEFKKESIQLIIALAAPLKQPIFQPDSYIKNFYQNIDSSWKNKSRVNHTTFVSLGGGIRDFIVRSDFTFDSAADINVLTSAVPGVWCSTDHLSIVWCKQLVLTLVRAIFDCVDITTKQLTNNKDTRLAVLKYHLLQRSAGKRFATNQHLRFATFERESNWYEKILRQFSILEPRGLKNTNYIMIRLHQDPDYEAGFIEAFNLNIKDWIFVCSADIVYKSVRMCAVGENLSNFTEIAPVLPSSRLKRKFVNMNLLDLKTKDFTHVIIKAPRSDSFMQINVDIYSKKDRIINFKVPSVYHLSRKIIIEETKENSVFYQINLIGFDSIWQGFILEANVLSCKTTKNHAVLSFIVPWARQYNHYYMDGKSSISIQLALVSAKTNNYDENEHSFLRAHFDASCKYKISIRPSIIVSAAQTALYFTIIVPAYVLAVLLLTVRQQELHLEKGKSVFFHVALCAAVRRYYLILQAAILGSKIFGLGIFLYLLPVPDFFTLEDLKLDLFFMNIILYAIAIVITYSLGVACYVTIIISGKAAHKMAFKFIAKTITGFMNWSEWFLSILNQTPILVSAILISLALTTSGALSLYLGSFFYFLKISNMYEDYLEDIFRYSLKLIADKVKNISKPKLSNNVEKFSEEITNEEKTEGESENNTQEYSVEPDQESCELVPAVEKDNTTSDDLKKSMELSENDPKENGLLSSIHFHVSLFLLWSFAALLYTPSLLVWAKNYHYSVFLEKDPAVIPSLILNVCGIVLWQSGVPFSNRKFTRIVSAILFILASISIIYASVSMYRLGYIISAAMIVQTVNEILAKFNS